MTRWTRQHEKKRKRIRELMANRVRPFGDTSPGAAARRRRQPMLAWCKTYLPHYFDCEFAPLHRRMMQAVGAPGMPTFIGAFRGAGKSVLLALARPLRRTLEGETPYFLYGSKVRRLAAQNMDYVRLELDHNERIRADYGAIETDGSQSTWTAEISREGRSAGDTDDTDNSNDTARAAPGVQQPISVKFEAFGIGMSPRGRRHGQHRPVEFVGDDLEDAELARNPRRENQLWDWLMDEVVPALEPRRFRFTVLGTMFGPECMLQKARRLARRHDSEGRPLARTFLQPVTGPHQCEGWEYDDEEASDEGPSEETEGRSAWPARFSDGDLDRTRAMIGLRNWMRNFALSPHDPDKPFQPDWPGNYRTDEVDHRQLDVVAFLDPALSIDSTACPRALVVVGADRSTGVRYALDAWIERGTPGEMVRRVFEVHHRFKPRVIGIESNGGYALIKPLLEHTARRRGTNPPVRYVTHSRPKEVRIESLCVQFEKGLWKFPENPGAGTKTLLDQFLNYPDGFVDGPDACAGCDELLPDGFRPEQRGAGYRSLSRRTDYACV